MPLLFLYSALSMPLFSVVIPTFNRIHLCKAAVESVLRQEFKDFELIVVDDGSTDGTSDAIRQYGDCVHLVRQENQGQSIARNAGIRLASGEYVAFLDSDDQWFPWTLATLHRVIAEGNRPSVIAGRNVSFQQELPELESLSRTFEIVRFNDVLDFYSQSGSVILETGVFVIRTDILRAVGGFVPTRDNSEDIDLCLRLGIAPGFIRLESPPMFAKRGHSDNIGLQLNLSDRGLKEIHLCEQAGAYPGGAIRKRARLMLITASFRRTTAHAALVGQIGMAWGLYRRSLLWNLRLRKLRFVFGLPVLVTVRALRKRLIAARSS